MGSSTGGLWRQRPAALHHNRRLSPALTGLSRDVPKDVAKQLLRALTIRQADLRQTNPSDDKKTKMLKEYITFYERELAFLRERGLI